MTMKATHSTRSLQRLPQYLAYLKIQRKKGVEMISSTVIAEDLRLNPVQVRKDLALATRAGRPKTGYPLAVLIGDLERFLGYHNTQDAFVIGTGKLGSALLGHEQFADYGLSILAGFDTDPTLHGREIYGKPVFPMEKLENLVRRMEVNIGILTVPPEAAQTACDQMVAGGIRAIWSFAATPLQVPEEVLVHQENLAASFAVLSNRLRRTLNEEGLEGGNHP